MKNEELFSRMNDVCKEIDKHDKDASALDKETGPQQETQSEEETDPHIRELLDKAWELQKQLDPLIREAMRDKPEALAEWDEILRMCDDIKPDDFDPGSDKS